ncbi:phosphate acetyltransferase [Maricaulis sp.]|uniref:phosphate acetyltransferase n=1 Tax=Maricaulis sp. TaxID=1486257 RepID=UPI002B273B87|nr:phosphate acetyltransferase [Maricaulis sp.]
MSEALLIGQTASIERRFSSADARDLQRLTGGTLTVEHVPEALINSMFSHLLGVHLPGRGTNYLKQETRFLSPAPLGQTLIASVEITRLRPDKQLVDLATRCVTADGAEIASGRALVLAKDVAGAFD